MLLAFYNNPSVTNIARLRQVNLGLTQPQHYTRDCSAS